MLNIVVPMAGAGSRFAKVGYKDPKPLILIHNTPMIELVIDNLRPAIPHRFIFICQKAHMETYQLEQRLKEWSPGCIVIPITGLTEGAACSVLYAKPYIDNEDGLMIANSDQYISVDINCYLAQMEERELDGLIMTMKANDPKWSFVALSDVGYVTTVVEKQVISDEATVGIYNYKQGKDFVLAAEAMIANNLRVNGEFYVAPTYNEMIAKGAHIGIYNIGSEGDGMYGLGTPQDLQAFLKLNLP